MNKLKTRRYRKRNSVRNKKNKKTKRGYRRKIGGIKRPITTLETPEAPRKRRTVNVYDNRANGIELFTETEGNQEIQMPLPERIDLFEQENVRPLVFTPIQENNMMIPQAPLRGRNNLFEVVTPPRGNLNDAFNDLNRQPFATPQEKIVRGSYYQGTISP